MPKSKSIGLTGGTGFIGARVLEKLLATGHTVTSIEHASCDLCDSTGVEKNLPDVDVFLHLGSRVDVGHSIDHPEEHLRENPAMLLNILETYRKRGKKPLIIFASTARLYAHHGGEDVTEESTPFPVEPYTASKMVCEIILQSYAHACGIPFVILRIDSVFGPGQPKNMFISEMILKGLSESVITTGNLKVQKNFVYVDDVADAFVCAAESPEKAWNQIFNIGGEPKSLEEVLPLILEALSSECNRTVSHVSDPASGRKSAFEVMPYRLVTTKAKEVLGWKPEISLRDGIRETVRFFRNV